jgi:coenzyme F420-0:L-glutamate ligase/coenzyme F420-1:gamma-L-glutamate ligase
VVAELHVHAVPDIPEVTAGVDLGLMIADAVTRSGRPLEAGDVLVVAQKVVSKAEGALVRLEDVAPSGLARHWASAHGKDARVIEVIFRESRRIVRMDRGVIVAETHHGFVCANAGVDASNVPPGCVTVLPRDPDRSARLLRDVINTALGTAVGIIVSDTFGRPWREGVINVAIGAAGVRPLQDYRGCADPFGRRLEASVIAVADELASAAELVTGKTARTPVALVHGTGEWAGDGTARLLLRDPSRDLFR